MFGTTQLLARKYEELKMEKDCVQFHIKSKYHENSFVLIDIDDYERVSKKDWLFQITYHNKRTGFKKITALCIFEGQLLSMHRFIMNAKKGQMVDHINGNTLDNRKKNLQFVTPSQNNWNRRKGYSENKQNKYSKYVGVSFKENFPTKHWRARIQVNGKSMYLGNYATEEEAYEVYKQAERKYRGKNHHLNEIIVTNGD